MRKLFLAIGLAAAVLFAFSGAEVRADHWHHGHGHHGHAHYGAYGGPSYGYANFGLYAPTYYIAPRYVYRPYPVYPTYYQPYYNAYPSSSLYVGGRNFSFGISGF